MHAHNTTGNKALFFTLSIYIILCIHERFTKMRARFHTMSVTKAAVLAMCSHCHNRIKSLKIMITIHKAKIHCTILNTSVLVPKSASFGLRGKRAIMFDSSSSHSKINEQAGSIRSSINTICTGYKIMGRQKIRGKIAIPAIGICTLTI